MSKLLFKCSLWLIFGLVLSLVAMVFSSHDRLHVYKTYLREKSPHILTRFQDLSVDMDETMLRRQYPNLSLSCIGQAPAETGLGDRVCHASINKADGHDALTFAAFFRKGKLAVVFVQTPWWAHTDSQAQLKAQLGSPNHISHQWLSNNAIMRWDLPNGQIETNRDRNWNLLTWGVIVWTGYPVASRAQAL